MGESKIEWTDTTWNPLVGCTKVSAGCKNCYAKTVHDRRHKAVLAGKDMPAQYAQPFETVQLKPERLSAPLRWRKPRRVFVNSMSDLFHEDVPDGYIVRVLMTMRRAYWHQFQVLTKRPERAREFFTRWADLSGESSEPRLVRGPEATRVAHPSGRGQLFAAYLESLVSTEPGGQVPAGAAWPTFDWMEGPRWWSTDPLPNMWLGTSVEDQRAAEERIPELLATPAAVRFLSCEPLLGPLDIAQWMHDSKCVRNEEIPFCICSEPREVGIDWVIVGGESGPVHRLTQIDDIRSVVAQCRVAAVPVFVKQTGAAPVVSNPHDLFAMSEEAWRAYDAQHAGEPFPRSGVLVRLRDRKGGDQDEWPEDLRVREFPAAAAGGQGATS